MRTPAEEAQKLSQALGELAGRLRAIDEGQALFNREDVDRIVSERLAREQKRTRKAERERDELREKLAAGVHEDRLGTLMGELGE